MRAAHPGRLLAAVLVASLSVALPGTSAARPHRLAEYAPQVIACTGGSRRPVVFVTTAGRSVRLGPGDNPLLSPDGRLVAAAGVGPHGHALLVYPAAGGKPRGYESFDEVDASPAGWSPDSRYVAFLVAPSSLGSGPEGVEVLDTVTGQARVIAYGLPAGASFAPTMPDRIVFSLLHLDFSSLGPGDIFTANVDGSARRQITHDHFSFAPLWGRAGIVYAHARLGRRGADPVYQIWTMDARGHHRRQITHLRGGRRAAGLVPGALSADGTRLLAGSGTGDTDSAYTVDLRTRRVRQLKIHGAAVRPGAISADGRRVLVWYGPAGSPPSTGTIATMPFDGGPATTLIKHAASPSWNG